MKRVDADEEGYPNLDIGYSATTKALFESGVKWMQYKTNASEMVPMS